MTKILKDNNGFSLIETSIVFIIIVIVLSVGYLLYKNNHKSTSAATSSNINNQTTPAQTIDKTANWITYKSSDGKISLKYPKTWVSATHPELCSNGILLLGADTNSVGKCATEDFGQVAFTWQSSNTNCSALSSDSWTINSSKTVTVDGVDGIKQTAIAKSSDQMQGGVPVGTPIINYCFNTGGYTYNANYTQLKSYNNDQSDFNLIVTKTLKFGN